MTNGTTGEEPPINESLQANMKRLMAGRSIEEVRLAMAEQGLKIGTETIHRAKLGKTGNRLQSLSKLAEFFGVTVDQLLQPDLGADLSAWPFSAELRERIAGLPALSVLAMENAMWAQLGEPAPLHIQERLRASRESFQQLSVPAQEVTFSGKAARKF